MIKSALIKLHLTIIIHFRTEVSTKILVHTTTSSKKKHSKNITLNPPFGSNVKTNVGLGKYFCDS